MSQGPSIQNYVTPWTHVHAFEDDTLHCAFALDAAADRWNAKAAQFVTKKMNGLEVPWIDPTFYNPEYHEQRLWLEKAAFEARRGVRSIGLLKAAIAESYWHPIAYELGAQDLYRGRIAFLAPRGGLRLVTKAGVRFIPEGKPVKGSDFASAAVLLGPGFRPRTYRYRDARTGQLIRRGAA